MYSMIIVMKNAVSCIWRRKWQPTPVFLPGESRGQRNLLGYSRRVGHNLATKPHHIFESWKESKSEVFITRKNLSM